MVEYDSIFYQASDHFFLSLLLLSSSIHIVGSPLINCLHPLITRKNNIHTLKALIDRIIFNIVILLGYFFYDYFIIIIILDAFCILLCLYYEDDVRKFSEGDDRDRLSYVILFVCLIYYKPLFFYFFILP